MAFIKQEIDNQGSRVITLGDTTYTYWHANSLNNELLSPIHRVDGSLASPSLRLRTGSVTQTFNWENSLELDDNGLLVDVHGLRQRINEVWDWYSNIAYSHSFTVKTISDCISRASEPDEVIYNTDDLEF
jgi:hypothetical protein